MPILSSKALPPLFNAVHSRPILWDVILKGFNGELGSRVSILPVHEWVGKLEVRTVNSSMQDLDDIVSILSIPGTVYQRAPSVH